MTAKNKHILLVSSEFPPLPGGIGNHAYNLAAHLDKNIYNVEVIADQRARGSEEKHFDQSLNFSVHRIGLRNFRFLMYLNRIKMLFKLIKHSNIIIASGKFSLWIVAFASLFFKRNFIAVIHGTEVNFRNKILRSTINASLRRFSKIIAVSNYTKSLVSNLNLIKVHVIPNGFDAKSWNLEDNFNIELEGGPKLITVGNVTKRKGQLNVIKHLPEALKEYPNMHYHCVGFPTEKDEFFKLAKKLGVDQHITFHGRVKHEELPGYLKASDVFIMLSSPTSSGDVEGFGIAVLEANYTGLPAIGALGCGIEDAIDNNRSGILIEHNNTTEFLNAVESILNNKNEFSINAKSWSLKHTWDIVIKSYIEKIESK